jgi:glycosyltransferase involved in cell wall biosynthesis
MPRPDRLRAAAGIPPDRDLLVYQGAFRPDQGIELLLDALDEPRLRDRPLAAAFIGFGPLEGRLRHAGAARPDRVRVLPPVPSEELLEWTAGADVAFVGTPPTTINQTLTTPNKLFEAAMAGVPVVVAGGTFTARLVRDHGLGAVVEEWTADGVASAIVALLAATPEERDARRRVIRRVALERLNWDVERERLLGVFRSLLA